MLFPSTPEQIGSLSTEIDHLIGGIVSPLSGQPVLRQTDLIVKGAENIQLSRVYIAPFMSTNFERDKWQRKEDQRHLHQYLEGYKGWQYFPHTRITFDSSFSEYHITDLNGVTLNFYKSGAKTLLASSTNAISNAIGDTPSGKYDFRNTKIHRLNHEWLTVTAPNGIKRFYLKTRSLTYQLFKEVLTNGKILRYHYDKTNNLIRVESMDPSEQHIYASLNISGTPRGGHCHFTTSTGLTADYNYELRRIKAKFRVIEDGYKIDRKINKAAPPILKSVNSPFYNDESMQYSDNFLVTSYSGKDEIFIPEYRGFGKDYEAKITKLSRPVGYNDAFEALYKINYKNKVTEVKDNDGNQIVYHYSKKHLLTAIKYLDNQNVLKKEHLFNWTENNWLESCEIRDGNNNLLLKKAFVFDSFGNPIKETITGDLSGNGIQESYTIRREFSQNGLHLPLKEEYDNGKEIAYSYLAETDLPLTKFTKENNRIILRKFSFYDEFNNLIKTIQDDGSAADSNDLTDVTERTIKNYVLRQQYPFLHMPEWIENKYWDNGEEKLLEKRHLTYDSYGNITEETFYDSNGEFAYTLHKEYNERGDLLSETNALGQKATYQYDSRGRRTFESNFSNRLQTTKSYDANGRLKKEHEDTAHIRMTLHSSITFMIRSLTRSIILISPLTILMTL